MCQNGRKIIPHHVVRPEHRSKHGSDTNERQRHADILTRTLGQHVSEEQKKQQLHLVNYMSSGPYGPTTTARAQMGCGQTKQTDEVSNQMTKIHKTDTYTGDN